MCAKFGRYTSAIWVGEAGIAAGFQPGLRPPLSNNIVERALQKAVLNRKNALFYKP
ncbi:MAG TPA: hypothetical protein VF283_14010 [Bryobacteraceae bacterium]